MRVDGPTQFSRLPIRPFHFHILAYAKRYGRGLYWRLWEQQESMPAPERRGLWKGKTLMENSRER